MALFGIILKIDMDSSEKFYRVVEKSLSLNNLKDIDEVDRSEFNGYLRKRYNVAEVQNCNEKDYFEMDEGRKRRGRIYSISKK